MAYVPPRGSLDVTWTSAQDYSPPTRIAAIWGDNAAQWILPFGSAAPTLGSPRLTWTQRVTAVAVGVGGSFGQAAVLLEPFDFRPRQFSVNASWAGAKRYLPPAGTITVTWKPADYVGPAGIGFDAPGEPVLRWTLFAQPPSLDQSAVGQPFALFHYQYARPEWVLNVSWVGADAYSAPVANVSAAWALPSESKQLSLTGWLSSAMGTVALDVLRTIASPPGITAPAPPGPVVVNKAAPLKPAGLIAMVFGEAQIRNQRNYLRPAGGVVTAFGTLRVEFERRAVGLTGIAAPAAGTPRIANANRTVQPGSIFQSFPSAHMVGGLRWLRPVGFDALRFGTRIIPEIQRAYPQGFAGVFGWPSTFNRWLLIKPPGFASTVQPADRWGNASVWNRRQYITLVFDPNSGLNPPVWSQWTLIENRNRVLVANGQNLARVPEPVVANTARPLQPLSISPVSTPLECRAGLVAYRARSVQLQGLEPPYLAGWSRVHNAAMTVVPKAFNGNVFGIAGANNTRRRFDRIGGFDAAWAGYPMIADRVRGLSFESRYSIAPPTLPLPELKLHTRYVEVPGNDFTGLGWCALAIHWNLITPRWTPQHIFGVPALRNVTPELRTFGRAADDFGTAFVRLQWRPVRPAETFTQLMGRTVIAFRDRSMTVTGIRAGALGDKLVVTKTGAPPYSQQTISLVGTVIEGEQVNEGNGITPPLEQVPAPTMNQQVLYVRQNETATQIGNPRVTANSIRVEPGYQELLVGEPLVSLRVRQLVVGPFESNGVYQPAAPRITPHTIWAVMDAPIQAKANHPSGGLHYVDGLNRAPGAVFGALRLTLRHRRLSISGIAATSVVPPGISNRRTYVHLAGFNNLRFGWLEVPGPRTLSQFDAVSASALGRPTMAPPPYTGPQTIRLSGWDSQRFTPLTIDFFNRYLKPVAFNATLMGDRKAGDSPYQWQGLRIGPQLPTIPQGVSMSAYGTAWVSPRVRELSISGYDALVCDYQLEAFDKRMRIIRREATRPSRTIFTVGISSFAGSVSNVRAALYRIHPDGDADQFRKGAF